MTTNTRTFLLADATVQLVAARVRWMITGLHLVCLYVARYFLNTYLVLKAGPRG